MYITLYLLLMNNHVVAQPLQQQIYNVALIPIEPSAAASFTAIAQENFSTHSDGYILGPDALPHM